MIRPNVTKELTNQDGSVMEYNLITETNEYACIVGQHKTKLYQLILTGGEAGFRCFMTYTKDGFAFFPIKLGEKEDQLWVEVLNMDDDLFRTYLSDNAKEGKDFVFKFDILLRLHSVKAINPLPTRPKRQEPKKKSFWRRIFKK